MMNQRKNHFLLKRKTTRFSSTGPFFAPEEEFDCPDEGECEIDWSLMPGWDDEEEDDVDDAPEASISPTTYGELAAQSMERDRLKFEVNWQIDECREDHDYCEDFCEECAGSGKMVCRFCRGTKFIVFGEDFRPCIICSEGQEDCSACRGTGQVAPWATTMDHFLNETLKQHDA